MNQEMMEAMRLDGEEPVLILDQDTGETIEVSPDALAAEGLSFAGNYMAKNGPIGPVHAYGHPRTMTKTQLKEQKMNEAEGYPSSLDEAQKVKDLEGKVEQMSAGISAILDRLGGQSSPASPASVKPSGTAPVSPAEPPVRSQTPTSAQRNLSQTALAALPSVGPQPTEKVVTLADGRKVKVPLTLGPATTEQSPNPMAVSVQEVPLIEQPDDSEGNGWDDVVEAVKEPTKPEVNPKAERTATLVTNVYEFMKANDTHRFFRRQLSGIHRHLGYNGWSKDLQRDFDARFQALLGDSVMVTNVCRKVMDMEFGHILGAKHVTSMCVATAGFLAFALCGT